MTDFEKFCMAFLVVVGVILSAGISWKISNKVGYRHGYEDALASVRPDTEYVDKPIYIDKPIPVVEYKDTGRIVYVTIPVKDSTDHADSTIVPLNPEVKRYADTVDNTYELQISGIVPNLDWIKVNQKTAYITVPIPEYKYPRFMLSPAISAVALPKDFFAGAGIAADFWSNRWQFSVECGYGINFGPGWNAHGLYGAGKVKYNLIRR